MKYCMFCGEEIPRQAIFCMKCGQRLPEQKEKETIKENDVKEDIPEENIHNDNSPDEDTSNKNTLNENLTNENNLEQKEQDTEIIEDEEDNIALSLLSKTKFSKVPTKKESIIPNSKLNTITEIKSDKVEEKKDEGIVIKKYIPKNKKQVETSKPVEAPKIIETPKPVETSKPVEITEPIENPKPVEPKQIEVPKSSEPIEAQSIENTEPLEISKTIEEPQQEEPSPLTPLVNDRDDYYDDEIPCLPEVEEKLNDIDKELKKSELNSNSIIADLDNNTTEDNKPEKNNKESGKKFNPERHRERVVYKKRNLSEEDETENEISSSREMNRSSSLGISNMNDDLNADEKADLEKYKKIKEENINVDDDSVLNLKKSNEGRKSSGRKKEARKNIDKEISSRKVNIIEHEEVKKEKDIDPDYDGYYENVKPIDFDKQRDNSSIIKVVLTSAIFLILISSVFYFLLTFFMQ